MVTQQAQPRFQGQLWLRALLAPALIIALVFISAGRLDYWQGWCYVALTSLTLLFTWLGMRDNPALIVERLQPGQGMTSWDKWYFALSTPLYILTLVVGCLDAGRWGWSPALPPWLYALSIAIYACGQALFLWAKRANHFFSSVVRIQSERGQQVCRSGPYRFVRHPGYVGGLLFGIVTPLVLGSYWGLVPAGIAALLLIARTALEDQLLRRELPGYADYALAVRYRLVPALW